MKSLRQALLGAVLMLAVLVAAGPADAGELKLYRPQNRPAAELVGLAFSLLAPEGIAVADPRTGTLILRGSPEALAQTLEALRALDQPLANYRIESTLTTQRELDHRGFSVDGWLNAGDLRIGRVRSSEDGLRVVFRTYRTQGTETFRTNLTVLEGHYGEIWTGSLLPVKVRTFQERNTDRTIFETTALVPLRSGIRVRSSAMFSDAMSTADLMRPMPSMVWVTMLWPF